MATYTTERDVLSVEEAGRRLGLGRSAAYDAVHRGEIPVLRFGRRFVVPLKAVEKILEEARPLTSSNTA